LKKIFALLTKGRKSETANETNTLIHPEKIFIEKGAKINCAVLNASNGPIYIGKNAEVMEVVLCAVPSHYAMTPP